MSDQEREALLPEMYADENGECFWMKAAGRTKEDALALLWATHEIKVAPEQVHLVHGIEHRTKRGEPWFTKLDKAKAEFWEIENG